MDNYEYGRGFNRSLPNGNAMGDALNRCFLAPGITEHCQFFFLPLFFYNFPLFLCPFRSFRELHLTENIQERFRFLYLPLKTTSRKMPLKEHGSADLATYLLECRLLQYMGMARPFEQKTPSTTQFLIEICWGVAVGLILRTLCCIPSSPFCRARGTSQRRAPANRSPVHERVTRGWPGVGDGLFTRCDPRTGGGAYLASERS